jgi:hypothetical protein
MRFNLMLYVSGKERTGEVDDPDTVVAKMVHGLAPQLLDTLVKLTPDEFEVACAASMMLSGACEMKALCTGDEGGIDFYGRIEIRQPSERIPKGVNLGLPGPPSTIASPWRIAPYAMSSPMPPARPLAAFIKRFCGAGRWALDGRGWRSADVNAK